MASRVTVITGASPRASRALVWALVLGLLIRLAALAQTGSLSTMIVDEQHYRQLATSIAAGDGFAMSPGQPTSIRPPLYPALVAAVWALTGTGNLQAVRVAQIALALATAWLVFLLGRRAFSPDAACYGAALAWLYPTGIFFNFLILTETLFTCLLAALVYLMIRLVQEPRPAAALACGAVLGLAALTRSVFWPLPLVLCPLFVLLIRSGLANRLALAMLVLAGYGAIVAPWAVRNTRLQQTVTIVDTMGGINLRMGNYEYTPDDRMWDAVSVRGEKNWAYTINEDLPGSPTEGQKDKWAQRKAIEYMRAHPGTTLRRALIKFADFWGLEREFIAGVQSGIFRPAPWVAAAGTAAMLLAYVLVVCLGAAGLWLAPPRDWRLHVLLLLPVAVTVAAHTIVFGHSRYHLPLMPILGLYAAALVIERARVMAWRPSPALAGAVVCNLLLAAIWIRQIVLVDLDRIANLLARIG